MGKDTNNKPRRKSRYLRRSLLALLCLAGAGLLAGMALFNGGVKPNRDMKWYVREGALEVAAPALGEGYASAEETDSEFVLPEENMRQLPTVEPVETLEPADAPEEGFAPEDIGGDPEIDPAELNEDLMEDEAEPEDDEADDEAEEAVPMGEVTLTISAAGDCTFEGEAGSKSYRRFLEYEEKYGYDYFMKGVRHIFEADDLTIVNLEGPLTNETKQHSHGFVFKADPKCVEILSGASVELCNVANNHSTDYGVNGLKETAQVLDQAGIGYCGYTVAYEATIKGVRVCALGFTKWDHSDEQIAKAVAAMRPNCDLLIVNMHWGREHVHDQNAQQVATGHAIIDAGADLVIGTHPHVLQGIEYYKGKYIVYSLGNFCFAGNANPEDKRCMIFQQTFSFAPGMGIVQAGLMDAGINIIPATVSSVNALNDFQPTVLPAEQGAQVLKFLSNYCNFKFKDVRWMPENYLAQNGLLQSGDEQAAAAGAGETEIEPEGDAPDDGDEAVAEDADAPEEFDGEAAPDDGEQAVDAVPLTDDEEAAGLAPWTDGEATDEAPWTDGEATDDAPWTDGEEAATDDAPAPVDESAKIAALFADDDKPAATAAPIDIDEPEPFFND